MKKKIIAVLLSACMLVSACPTGAFAMSDEETNTYTATGDVMQGGTPVVDETPAPEETAAPEETPTPTPEETPTPAPAETPAPVEVKAQATPTAGAEETAPAKQSEEAGISTAMLLPDDDKKPAVDTYCFYDADGTELTEWQQTVAEDEVLLEPTAPTKENARFVGWYDESDNLFEGFGKITSVTGGATVKLTAKFEDVRYVYFMNKDGSSVCYTAEGEAETAVSSSDLKAAENTVNLMLDAKSHVVGWSTVPNGKATTVTFAKDEIVTKVYPVIESGFWVKFDTNGGSHVQSVFCEPGITLELSQVPTRNGYTFDGWYIGKEKVESVSASATVTAHWTASNNTKYTVIHWLENADDDEYTLDGTETKTGTTGSETNAAAKSYTGFTAQTIKQETIAGDGSTIVNVYYKRDLYDVKFMKRTCNKEEHTHGFGCLLWCDKEEHQHSENCYTEITGLTIHAKHGANINDKWPTYQGSNTWAVNPTGGPYQVNIDTMPMGGDTFYGPKTGQGSETAYYYVEALPGASNTVTVGGIKYVLHHYDTSPGTGYTVTQEDKYSITGFKYSRGTQNGSSYNGAKFYYTRESYNITFFNNGIKDKTSSYKYEASIAGAYYEPKRPDKINNMDAKDYIFAGWYDNKLCKGEPFVFTGKTMPATGITLYAKWQAPQVNATVYLSASADSKSETFSVPYGKKITESEGFNAIIARIKAETGEAPSAWFVVTGEGRVLFDLDTPLYSSVTLYPFFASSSEGYTVTYEEEGTDEPAKDEQKYLTGSRAGILAPVNGENFRAWEMEDGKLIHPGDKITVTKNITLRAVYTIKPQTVTITYHYNFGGSTQIFEDKGYPKNTTATVRSYDYVGFTEPTGYKFLGWATARDSSTIEYAAGDPVFVDANGDNDLYAVWQVKTYTVTWKDWNGTVLETDTDVEYNSDPRYDGKNPTRAADAQYTYTFKGWDKPLEKVTKDVTYTAVYEETINKYTVTWKNDDGSVLRTDKNVEYGTMPNYGANPTKAADAQYTYTFKGWTPKVKTVTGDAVYTAVYDKAVNKYTVTWKNDDGSVLRTDKNVEYGTMPNYGANPTKAADAQYTYTFKGWTPKVKTVTGDAVYTAVYDKAVNKYTVTWKNDDGSVLRTDKNVEYGTMPNYGANPTKAADAQYTYTFKDWTPKIETVTGDATYQATYTKEANSYTLTYNLDGGEWENDTTYTYPKKYNEEVEVKADPTKTGYTFAGWTSAEVKVVNGKFTMPAKDVTLKAKWEANIYKVTYDLDGGEWTEATNEFPYEYKATVEVVKTVPTREGYKFSGWRSEEVTIENDAFTMPAKNVVLKAVWEANPTPAPTEEPTPTPAPTEEPTPTPAPTEEPTPTPAPTEEPTPTPAPTEEPTPTPAPTEEPTPTPAPTEESTPTPAPNPNPNPAAPTPTPVAPVVPATVATPTPKPTATPSTTPSDNGGKGDGNNDGEIGETINDNETPLANGEDIADNATPLAGLGTGAWALINLILTIVTTLLSILLLIGYIGKKKKALEDEDGNVVLDENGKEVMEYEKNKKGLWRLISIIPALIAIIVFIFTEDMTLPMIFVDKWTILHVVIALVQVVVMVLCKKKKDENDEDENAANA